jgi:hypothetical protein
MPINARLTTVVVLLGSALLAATGPAAAVDQPGQPTKPGHPYSIPVGAITDLGDLTKVANLGNDLAGLLGH